MNCLFNGGEAFLDDLHPVKQTLSECEVFSANGWRIQLFLQQRGCQLSLAPAGEQTEDIRKQVREHPGDHCRRSARQYLAQAPARFSFQRLRIPGSDGPFEVANHSLQ